MIVETVRNIIKQVRPVNSFYALEPMPFILPGSLDYPVFLQEAGKLKDVPFMLEHLDRQEEYRLAAEYVREVGRKTGIVFAG